MGDIRCYWCELCNINCNSPNQLRAHQSSKSHIRKCRIGLSVPESSKFDCYQPWQRSPKSNSSTLDCPFCSEEVSITEIPSHVCKNAPLINASSASNFSAFDLFSNQKVSCAEKSEFFCPICQVALHSEVNFTVHMQGKRHLEKLKQRNTPQHQNKFFSDLTAMSCSTEGLYLLEANDDPYKGASFTKPFVKLMSPDPSTLNAIVADNRYSCNVCKLELNSEAQLKLHVNGRKHRNMVFQCNAEVNLSGVCDTPSSPPSVTSAVPLNSVLCPVCEVPVMFTEVDHHNKGRTHIFKTAMSGCAKVCRDCLTDRAFRRCFSSRLSFIYKNITPLPELLQKYLTKVAESDEDTVVHVPCSESALIAHMALVIALGIALENRVDMDQALCHCFAVWSCPTKAIIPQRMKEVRQITEQLSKDRPRLVNILKDSFSQDDQTCEITQHEIAFSTPGGLLNMLESHASLHRAICALILTDVERCVASDSTEGLITYFLASNGEDFPNRPRIIILTTKELPNWSFAKSFSVVQ